MIGGFSYYLWIQVASVINGVTGRTDDKLTGNKQNKDKKTELSPPVGPLR